MKNNSFHLAYSIDNQDIAQEIDNHLSRVGIHLEHMVVSHDQGETPLRERLKDAPHFILLLVSDNLLKNINAMNRGLFMIQELTLNQRVQPIIIDGKHRIKGTDTYETVPTLFDRMSYVIRYMNFWQDSYLDMRKARRDIPKEEEESFDERLKIVRSISSEMGDFLKTLKNNSFWTYEQLTHNAYELFFQAMNKPGLHDALKLAIANGEIPKVSPTPPPPIVEKKEVTPPIEIAHKEEIKKEPTIETPPVEIIGETKKEIPTPPEEVISKKEIHSFTPEITPRDDDELLKISEQQLKKKGKTPLLDKLLQHRREETQLQKNKITPEKIVRVAPVQKSEPVAEKDETFEQTINDIIEEENKIVEPPKVETPKINLKEDSLLGAIFHDDDEELDSDSMIADFSLSNSSDSNKKKSKKKDWKAQLKEAERIIDEGKLYAGLNLIRESVEKNQENGELRYKYAIHLMDGAESHKAAKRELEKVVLLDKKNTDAFYRLAILAEKKGDYLLAKSYYEKAMELNEHNSNLHYKLGLLVANHFPDLQDQAYNYFKKSIKKDSSNADAHYRIGLILDEHFKKPKKAMSQFETTLKLQQEHPFVNYDLALLHYRFGAFKKAAQYYKQACKINPEFKTETNDRAFLSSVKNKEAIDLPSTSEDFLHDFSQASLTATPKASKREITTSTKKIPQKRNENFEKVVLISGATSGIGKATATLFAKNGFRVILTGRRTDRLANLKAEFEENFPTEIKTLEFDVRYMDAAEKAISSLGKEWSNIDILINNAGLAKGFEPIHEGKLEDWETMIDTNVKGLLYLTRLISPKMVARRKGHIINVCSTAGHEVYPKGNVYCATKHAVDALTKGMRLDLYQHGLRVSQVSPAHVEETEFARVRFDWDEEKAKIYKDFQPLRSVDVANTIYFIATQPEYVNIQDVLMMGRQQANSTNIDRSGR